MKSILVKPFSKLTNLILLSGAILILAACSDSTYNVPGDDNDPVVIIVIPPEVPEPLSVVISGVVVDQVTGNVINNARVDFFEGLEKATNIILPDGTATDGEDLANGSFQVSAGDIDQFRAVASAAGYLDKTAIVDIDAEAQIVYVVLELLAEEVEGVAAAEEVFADEIGEDFAVKAEGITLTSDDSAGDKTTEGQAEVAITGGIQFLDENNQVIEVAAVNLEVSYIETQEATDEDEEVLSIADVIPEGLNSESDGENVLVPVGVTEVNMTDENGTQIKKFSGDITITLYLPATTIDPATGNTITQASSFRVRTYDTETQVWTTEPEDAVTVLAQQGDLFPVEVTVDHLTIFALTAEVTACANDATLNFTGSAVPATGLELVVEAGDLRETYAISEESFVISKDDILKDEDGYKVYVTDSTGVSWLAEAAEPVSDGYTLCATEATTINLEAPAQPVTYEKVLDLALQCTNDSLVTTALANAVVSYSSDTNPIPVIAVENSAGSYQLTGLTEGSTYTVTVDTRTVEAGVVVYDQSNNGILTDGANETRNIGVSCSSATGTGTGSS
jgi:hypothetical protein